MEASEEDAAGFGAKTGSLEIASRLILALLDAIVSSHPCRGLAPPSSLSCCSLARPITSAASRCPIRPLKSVSPVPVTWRELLQERVAMR